MSLGVVLCPMRKPVRIVQAMARIAIVMRWIFLVLGYWEVYMLGPSSTPADLHSCLSMLRRSELVPRSNDSRDIDDLGDMI
jgi:hypothetical protein